MSTATAEFTCEVCDAPLRYRGGPHRPRWCPEHRAAREQQAKLERQRRYNARNAPAAKGLKCRACGSPMLVPAELCVFCEVESGMREPI